MLRAGVLAYSLSTDQEENVYGDWLYSLVLGVDDFATALFTNWQELLASETGAFPWQKEWFVGIFSWALKFTLKLWVEREPNLKASSFLEASLPNGQLRLLRINDESI